MQRRARVHVLEHHMSSIVGGRAVCVCWSASGPSTLSFRIYRAPLTVLCRSCKLSETEFAAVQSTSPVQSSPVQSSPVQSIPVQSISPPIVYSRGQPYTTLSQPYTFCGLNENPLLWYKPVIPLLLRGLADTLLGLRPRSVYVLNLFVVVV